MTISGKSFSDRGFKVDVDRKSCRVLITFDSSKADSGHSDWLAKVENRVGLGELDPQPYWGFDDLRNKAGTKILNCFFVVAKSKKEKGKEYFQYDRILMLRKFNFDKFLNAIDAGCLYVDFDARTGHNHGTKFRLREDKWPELYSDVTVIE